jgi:hypothetical protein
MCILCWHSAPEAKNFEQVVLLSVLSHGIATFLLESRRRLVVIRIQLETNFVCHPTSRSLTLNFTAGLF